MIPLVDVLAGRPYPGRGCLAACSMSGDLMLGYFLTGRGEASRARSIRARDDGDVEVSGRTGQQDALRHYVAAARRGEWLVVGNGLQVVPVAEELARSGDIAGAWAPHTYEPDPPIHTPRVWVAWHSSRGLVFGQARRSLRTDGGPDRVAWLVDEIPPGGGVLLTTYQGTENDVATAREPVDVGVSFQTPAELVEAIWQSLAPRVRVGSFVVDTNGAHEPFIRSPSVDVREG